MPSCKGGCASYSAPREKYPNFDTIKDEDPVKIDCQMFYSYLKHEIVSYRFCHSGTSSSGFHSPYIKVINSKMSTIPQRNKFADALAHYASTGERQGLCNIINNIISTIAKSIQSFEDQEILIEMYHRLAEFHSMPTNPVITLETYHNQKLQHHKMFHDFHKILHRLQKSIMPLRDLCIWQVNPYHNQNIPVDVLNRYSNLVPQPKQNYDSDQPRNTLIIAIQQYILVNKSRYQFPSDKAGKHFIDNMLVLNGYEQDSKLIQQYVQAFEISQIPQATPKCDLALGAELRLAVREMIDIHEQTQTKNKP